MISARRRQLQSNVLQQKYIISALYPQGPLSPDTHAKLMNKLKDMGF